MVEELIGLKMMKVDQMSTSMILPPLPAFANAFLILFLLILDPKALSAKLMYFKLFLVAFIINTTWSMCFSPILFFAKLTFSTPPSQRALQMALRPSSVSALPERSRALVGYCFMEVLSAFALRSVMFLPARSTSLCLPFRAYALYSSLSDGFFLIGLVGPVLEPFF